MITHVVNVMVLAANAEQFYDFMINPNDEQYVQWWPEEHRQYHIIKHGDNSHLGDVVYFDECIGETHKLAFYAVVKTAERPNTIVWQMKKAGVKLPAYVKLELIDSLDGLGVTHELKIGFESFPGRLLDPFIRLYFSKSFQTALEAHCQAEWPKLAMYIKNKQ